MRCSVGLPRSGTTLVEQILDAHPEACGIGEYPGLPEIVGRLRDDLGSQRGLDRKSTRLNSSHMSESRMPSSA